MSPAPSPPAPSSAGSFVRSAGAWLLALGGVAVLVGLIVRYADRFGVQDLTRDAAVSDHHPPPPDPRNEAALEAFRRFPSGAVALQPLIDATPAGGTLTLDGKLYAAPGKIDRPLRLQGVPGTVIDGGGVGSILTVTADDVVLAGLTLRHSGERHETSDAAIRLRARHAIVKDNVIEDCLLGVELRQADGNIIRRNRITSKDFPPGLRGDSVKIWYSNNNIVEDNFIDQVRDTVVWYSSGNRLSNNRIVNSRYGIHLMYAHNNELDGNQFLSNSVGIFLMYANDNRLTDNAIHDSHGPSGIGLGLKESSNNHVAHNDLFANARGIFLDASPYDPEGLNRFEANRIAYNGLAIAFHSDWEGNVFTGNDFIGNHGEAMVGGGGTAMRNRFEGNRWDGYVGFDPAGTGLGATPFELWSWADRLWMDVPDAQFFRAAPSLELLDFVERLGAFVEPRLILRDARPLFVAPVPVAGVRSVGLRAVDPRALGSSAVGSRTLRPRSGESRL